MSYTNVNAMARQMCGMPPSYQQAMRVVDTNRPKRARHTPDFYSHVSGIPCGILIGEVNVQKAQPWNDASDLDFYGCKEVEFTVLDNSGYEAPWLARKITAADTLRIELFILSMVEDV